MLKRLLRKVKRIVDKPTHALYQHIFGRRKVCTAHEKKISMVVVLKKAREEQVGVHNQGLMHLAFIARIGHCPCDGCPKFNLCADLELACHKYLDYYGEK
jgi:hypothetical protein